MYKGQGQCQKKSDGKICSSHIALIFNQYTSYLVVVFNVKCLTVYNIMFLVVALSMFYTVWMYENVNYIKEKCI